ncbi:hypothetical protein BCV72DRAFT_220469 [Rhizopus microsporus var. microsporus]|uniref:Uncharacterized protein n=2 Tax=Rhizopus microsporus TaxID=58291 RepID=A0A2G4SGU4_RHIZD|nr:uncharacterized protein RHIMIDRAFT_270841 [Rhizopus microsporus ATCC 52813]ORE10993.1 hypothetical protein BCV72DRAFT_220469 [Rhizopus microsporus var. microsporus]PHZ07985.1 hypothetical protein RHIMIDRAFT_270841 [Rhizopus microsporus ATCC 52813]
MSGQQTQEDLKEIAKQLSDAYYKILQHSTLSEQTILDSLSLLSKYSHDLPLSWFTNEFLDQLFALKTKFENTNGLLSIITLLSAWLRLSKDNDHRQKLALDILESILRKDDTARLQKEAWIGWVALIGKGNHDARVLDGMINVVERYGQAQSLELDAGLAHALAMTNTLNEFEIEPCQRLLNVYAKHASARGFDGARALMDALEHATDVRSQEKPQTRAEADLATLVQLVIDLEDKARLSALAGIVRALQFNQGKNTKKVIKQREKAEKALMEQLSIALTSGHACQDTLAYIASRCLLQVPEKELTHLPSADLLRVLVSSLLTSALAIQHQEPLSRLTNSKESVEEIKAFVDQPLFKQVGRISRTIAKIIQVVDIRQAEHIMDRFVGFSYNVFIDWDQFIISNIDADLYKQIEEHAWTFLKSVLFSFTVILKAIAVDIPNGQGLVEVPNAAQDTLSIFANLHFITHHLGQGAGRQAYQDTLTNVVAYLLQPDHQCQLNRLLSSAFKEYSQPLYTNDATPAVELLSTVKQMRLLFFTDLLEQTVKSVDDTALEHQILPVIYPILKWKRVENKDLYESAHTVVISTFLAAKPVCSELSIAYADILIDNFPEPINLDQLRFGFTTMVKALCEIDDALAWFVVSRLIEKIHSLEMVSRAEYLTVLIDMLKPLSLGPFFPSILDEIRAQVQVQTPKMQLATLKIIFDTVSGPGISDMRRKQAVGWYLNLKRELKL